jgi:hypothetical protein
MRMKMYLSKEDKDELRADARARAERAERLLASLVLQLLEETRKKYLRDFGVTALPIFELNEILSAYGLKVRSEARPS